MDAPSAVAALENDTYRFFTNFARRPTGSLGEEGGATWFRSGIASINYNGVAGVGVEVDATLERVRAWGVPARWIVNSASTPPAFEAKLTERGLEMFDQWPGMVSPIEDLPRPQPDGVTCSVVSSDTDYDEWADVFRDAFGLPPAAAANMREAHHWPCFHDELRTYLILRDDRQAVATGILHTTPGVAGIYGIAVRRAAQKRGLGKLATLVTVQEGSRRGANLAILQASKEGFPVYQKLGFQTICSFRSWRIA
jgi:hypothetical protein